MLTLKVQLKDAQTAKKFLIDNNLLLGDYRPAAEGGFIYLPVKEKTDLPINATYEEKDLEKARQGKDYTDYLKGLSAQQKSDLPASYDIIGDIIIIDLKDSVKGLDKEIGEALLKANKNIKTVLKKSGIHEGEFRTQPLLHVAGINTKETIYRENNASIKLDVEQVYFSPRLSTERKRIYQMVKPKEKILVMFSGCAPYPVVLAKNTQAQKIIGIEKNPAAHAYGLINLKLNKIKNVELMNGDVRLIVPELSEKFDRILMPLPKDAEDFLDLLKHVSKKDTIVHFYDFEHETELSKGEEKALKAYPSAKILRTVKCGQYSPGKFRICVDFTM